MEIIRQRSLYDRAFNTRIKHYPLVNISKIAYASKPVFKEKGWECTSREKIAKPQTKDNRS